MGEGKGLGENHKGRAIDFTGGTGFIDSLYTLNV
jgi:hypothetical protein